VPYEGAGKAVRPVHETLTKVAPRRSGHNLGWLAAELDADFIALSFVRSAADIELLRSMALERGSAARLVAKIEKIEAYEALDEIIAVSDGLMVARGDYGVEAGVARLESMIHRPNRPAPKPPTSPTPSSTAPPP
jgi:pyruvate kinase